MEGNLECLNCFVVVGEWFMEFGDDVNNKNEDHFLKPISYALKFQEKFMTWSYLFFVYMTSFNQNCLGN